MKRYFALFLALAMTVCLLCGCGSTSTEANKMTGAVADGMAEIGTTEVVMEDAESMLSGSGTTTEAVIPESTKLVRKAWIDAETEDLDPLLNTINQRISQLNGYIENREVYNGTKRGGYAYRYANLTVRIPVDGMNDFVSQINENANVTSTNETTENITLTYVATESRMKALETEQARLLELLAQAESMDDLLQIEKRLTTVRTELETVTSQLRVYDNMVDYATIYLNLTEVKEYTVTQEPETVWERISRGFSENLKGLGNFFVELFVGLIVALPWLIPLGLAILIIVLLIKRKKQKKTKPAPEEK